MEPEHFEALYPDTVRFEEVEKVLGYIKEGSSCQVLGLPGVGRSNLLGLLAYNKNVRLKHLGADNNKNFHFVMINFSEIRKRPVFDAMKYLFLNLVDSLRERTMEEEYKKVIDIFKESLKFHDELVFFQGFKQAIDYLALEKKLTIVFLFDRFEDYIPTVTGDFFADLRILRNRAKYHFSVVFSLNKPLEDLLEPSLLADFYEFVASHHVYVKIHDEKGVEFRINYLEKITGKKLSEPSVGKVLALTGGHGKLTRLAMEFALSHGYKEEEFEKLLFTQKSVRGAVMEIWLSLSPSEQSYLLESAYKNQESNPYLESVGLIKDRKVQIPLFDDFIKSEYTEVQIEKAKIVYDENTNSIKRGDVVLSDDLTSSEFRLLRYLLQNKERVVEREEIVNVVWPSVKSTAGITDQAIDQLIFRLRRKIEEDPIAPQHLQTVKGRGVKFCS